MAGLRVRDEVGMGDLMKMEGVRRNVGNIGTVYTVDGFWHSSQKVQCYEFTTLLEHIAFGNSYWSARARCCGL